MKSKKKLPDQSINLSKSRFLKELKQSIDEVNLAKRGKVKLKTAEELLAEL
jgi:hypothetical protein